jgi:hypothetical protein
VGNSFSHILWYSMQMRDGPPAPLELVDLVIQKLDNSILLLGSVYMELHPDYLNRVRQHVQPRFILYGSLVAHQGILRYRHFRRNVVKWSSKKVTR